MVYMVCVCRVVIGLKSDCKLKIVFEIIYQIRWKVHFSNITHFSSPLLPSIQQNNPLFHFNTPIFQLPPFKASFSVILGGGMGVENWRWGDGLKCWLFHSSSSHHYQTNNNNRDITWKNIIKTFWGEPIGGALSLISDVSPPHEHVCRLNKIPKNQLEALRWKRGAQMEDIAIIAIFRTYLVFNPYDDGGYCKSSGGFSMLFRAITWEQWRSGNFREF